MTHLLPLLLALAAPTGEASPVPPDLELVLISSARLLWVRLDVSADGMSARAGWDRALRAIFDASDRDGDGSLDRDEAARLPSAFALRQGYPYLNPGFPPDWPLLDRDRDGRAGFVEVVDAYRGQRVGGVQVGLGRSRETPAINRALVDLLGRSGPGGLDDAIRGLDLDEDELIAPAELVEGTPQPASSSAEDLSGLADVDGPLIVLPAGPGRGTTLDRLFRRLDRDGDGTLTLEESLLPREVAGASDRDGDSRLGPGEFASRFDGTADARHSIRLAPDAPSPAILLDAGDVRMTIVAAAGTLDENLGAAARRLRSQFGEADIDRDGRVVADEADAPNAAELRRAIAPADRDGDGVLTRGELDAWLAIQAAVVRCHATLAVIDHGPSLFEAIDVDRDGRLSRRELATSHPRLEGSAPGRDGGASTTALPRTLSATLARGRARTPFLPPRRGPSWFLAMDRNRDGDVSRGEYLGAPAEFDRLDADRDGLLSAEEAAPR